MTAPETSGSSSAAWAPRASARQTASPMSWLPMLATCTASSLASNPMPGAAAIRDSIENIPERYARDGRAFSAPAMVPPVANTVTRGRAGEVLVARGRAMPGIMAAERRLSSRLGASGLGMLLEEIPHQLIRADAHGRLARSLRPGRVRVVARPGVSAVADDKGLDGAAAGPAMVGYPDDGEAVVERGGGILGDRGRGVALVVADPEADGVVDGEQALPAPGLAREVDEGIVRAVE